MISLWKGFLRVCNEYWYLIACHLFQYANTKFLLYACHFTRYILNTKRKCKTHFFPWKICNNLLDQLLLLFSHSVMTLRPHGLQHARLPCPSPSSRACSNSCVLSQWCNPTISSFVGPFSSSLQSFPTSGSFVKNQLFASGGQSIGASASASVFAMNIQDWSPLGLTDLVSLQSKGLSKVFSNTTVQKLQFFSVQPTLWSSSHIHKWLLEKP